ncbi:MAG: hypothetical protein KKF50_00480 [Nanoarchaeota archaeon]|nr:hypothetical protein [Nanoarchaeota archaeon]
MKKKGISAVVATILIILIVVVGIGIVWKVILPLFAELEFLSYSDVRMNIVMQGYTIYDEDGHFAFVQIGRGADEVNVTGLEIGFRFDGTTKTYQTKVVPAPGGKHVYKFNFTNDSIYGIPQGVVPDIVTVAPVFIFNNQFRLGQILDEKPLPSGKIYLSAGDWINANLEAAENIVVIHLGPSNVPGTPVNGTEEEVSMICEGDNLVYDNGTFIETCEFGCEDGVCVEEVCSIGEVKYGSGCAIEIDRCQILNQEGETYILNRSITTIGDCLTITASNIIIDGAGYSITGDGGAGDDGITTPTNSNLVNIIIKNFGNIGTFERGIYFDRVNNSLIYNNTMNSQVAQYTYGVYLVNSNSNRIEGNRINWNATGSHKRACGIYLQAHWRSSTNDNNFISNNISVYSEDEGYGIILHVNGYSENNTVQYNNVNVISPTGIAAGINVEAWEVVFSSTTVQYNNINVDSWVSTGIYIQLQGGDLKSSTFQGNIINVNSTSGSYGYYTESYSGTFGLDNSIYNETINAYSSASGTQIRSAGVALTYSDSLTNISHLTINSTAPNAFASDIFIYGGGDGNVFRNMNLLGSNWSSYIANLGGKNNTFVNVSYNGGEFVGTSADLTRKWYYQAYVNDGVNPIKGASIHGVSADGLKEFSAVTSIGGMTEVLELGEYVNNAGLKTFYSPYSLTVSKEGYETFNSVVVLDENILRDNIQMIPV